MRASLVFSLFRRNLIPILLMFLMVAFAIFMYSNGQKVTGPFIFADELEYFSFARNIFYGNDLTDHRQYGILYPIVCSFFFACRNFEVAYYGIRILNIVILLSAVIPTYLFIKAWFPQKWLHFFLPLLVVLAPFSGFVYLIWAEPLYYALFYWFVYLFDRFLKRPTPILGVITGCILGGLFVVKPGAGFIIQVAVAFSLAWAMFLVIREQRKQFLGSCLLLFLGSCVCAMPWVYRNVSMGLGILGYYGHSQELALMVQEFGWKKLIENIVLSFFYQFSYLFIGSYGLIVLGFVAFFKKCRQFGNPQLIVMLFTLVSTLGLLALSSFGMSVHHGTHYWYPNGRYYSVILPLIIFVSLKLLLNVSERNEKRFLSVVVGGSLLVALLATPLIAISPISIVNCSELALPMWIIDKGQIIWRGRYDPMILERILYALIFAGWAWCVIWATRWKKWTYSLVILLLMGSLTNTYVSHYYVAMLGHTQSHVNNAVREFAVHNQIPSHVTIDNDLRQTNISYLLKFWRNQKECDFISLRENKHAEVLRNGFLFTNKSLSFPLLYQFPSFEIYDLKECPASDVE